MRYLIVLFTLVISCFPQPPPKEKAREKVMNIDTKYAMERWVSVSTDDSHATGFVLATDMVLTCFHALQVDSDIMVNGKPAKVIAVSPKHDMAVLFTETSHFDVIQTAPFTVGEQIFFIGDPAKHRGALVKGYVADVMNGHIYIDARVVSGASGSGVYNEQGLIGMLCSVEVNQNNGLVGFGVVTPSATIMEVLLEAGK